MTISTTTSHRGRQLVGASALLLALSLAGCGGGGSDAAGSATTAAPAAVETVPDSAFASTEAAITYQRTLTADDRAEPLQIGNLKPPTNDRIEPVDIG